LLIHVNHLELDQFSYGSKDYVYAHVDPLGFYFMLFVVLFQVKYLSVAGAELLLRFFATFWSLLHPNADISLSLASARHRVGYDATNHGLHLFVVCPKCRSIYPYLLDSQQDLNLARMTPEVAKSRFGQLYCTSVPFRMKYSPNAHTATCNENLFSYTRTNMATPRMICPYNSIIDSLRVMFRRPGFAAILDHWKRHPLPRDHMADIYHGSIWHSIRDDSSNIFVENQYAISFSIGLDWFNPGQKMIYSVGCLYLYINNLPLHLRHSIENTILLAVLPGPREQTELQLNYVLDYIRDELVTLFGGVYMEVFGLTTAVRIIAALHQVKGDLPASAKLSGFTSTNAYISCRQCKHIYPRRTNNPAQVNYGATIHLDAIPRRTGAEHVANGLLWKNARSVQARKVVQDASGSKYSSLQDLHYVDLVNASPHDIMHMVYIGLVGRFVHNWVDKVPHDLVPGDTMFGNGVLKKMTNMIERISRPSGFQSPSREKILSGFSNMKAAEWRTLLFCYSPIVFPHFLSGDHWNLWSNLYNGMMILEQPVVTKEKVEEAHLMFVEVVRLSIDLFGEDSIVPNAHHLLHVREYVLLHGHIRSYSTYAVERDNQAIKLYNSNYKIGFELTMMKKFKEEFHRGDYIRGIDKSIFNNQATLEQFLIDSFLDGNMDSYAMDNFDFYGFILDSMNPAKHLRGSEPLPPTDIAKLNIGDFLEELSAVDHGLLVDYYNSLRVHGSIPFVLSTSTDVGIPVRYNVRYFPEVTLIGQLYRSRLSRSARSRVIKTVKPDGSFLVGEVQYFFAHDAFLDGDLSQATRHYFAFVKWYQEPTQEFTSHQGTGVSFVKKFFRELDHSCILPVHKISGCVGTSPGEDYHLLVVDIPRKVSSDKSDN
jgi:hypothetical protein